MQRGLVLKHLHRVDADIQMGGRETQAPQCPPPQCDPQNTPPSIKPSAVCFALPACEYADIKLI